MYCEYIEYSEYIVVSSVTDLIVDGGAIVQAAGRWLPTAAADLQVHRFPLPVISSTAAHSLSSSSSSSSMIIRGWYNRPNSGQPTFRILLSCCSRSGLYKCTCFLPKLVPQLLPFILRVSLKHNQIKTRKISSWPNNAWPQFQLFTRLLILADFNEIPPTHEYFKTA
jgi:hypothetical protein